MRIVLEDYPCYTRIGTVSVSRYGRRTRRTRPRLPIIEGSVAFGSAQVPVKALLDNGNDVTIVKPDKVKEIERHVGGMIPVESRLLYYGQSGGSSEPAYALAFVFPGDHQYYSSAYGFIAPSNWYFDIADVWLGQDLFRQLVVTFNGVKGTVTIIDP